MPNQSNGYMKALVRVTKTVGDVFIRMCITSSLMISVYPGIWQTKIVVTGSYSLFRRISRRDSSTMSI